MAQDHAGFGGEARAGADISDNAAQFL